MATDDRTQVVLLHGVGLDRHVWDPLIDRLDPDRFRVTALDLLGHGDSDPAPEGTTLSELADRVAEDLEGGSHLVGFSLGALVAQHLAIHRPELVTTLTSVNSVCDRTLAEREAVQFRLTTAQADFRASVLASLHRWFDGTDVPHDVVDATERTLLTNDIASYLNCYRVFATADAEIAPRLACILAPSLAITGSDDPGSTPEMSRRLGAAIPDCAVIVLDDTRHMLPVQRPDQLAVALTDFIQRHRTEPDSLRS